MCVGVHAKYYSITHGPLVSARVMCVAARVGGRERERERERERRVKSENKSAWVSE